jgi:membrane protein DedA with SNARE-associated domain
MKLSDKDSPLRVYTIAGHLAWLVITPLLVSVGGGNWLVTKMGWSGRVMILFVLLGLVVMISSTAMYFKQLIKMYDEPKPPKPPEDMNDYDY